MIEIHCRLAALLAEKGVSRQALAEATQLPVETIDALCERSARTVDLREVALILSALDCSELSDLFEIVPRAVPHDLSPLPYLTDRDWDSPCAASQDGRHRWFKNFEVSDSVYQEFTCVACHRRLALIL